MTARPCLEPPRMTESSELTENPLVASLSEWQAAQFFCNRSSIGDAACAGSTRSKRAQAKRLWLGKQKRIESIIDLSISRLMRSGLRTLDLPRWSAYY